MRIGLFGGTFNPVHLGHTASAEAVLIEFDLDMILFIPSKIPVHKDSENVISSFDRCEMIKLAIQENSKFKLSTIEIEREEQSYSIITVRDIKKIYSLDDIFFISGMDSINTFTTWKDYQSLGKEIPFIILRRGGKELDTSIHKYIDRLYLSKNEEIDISSTDLRDLLKKNLDTSGMLDVKVRDYIREKRLYLN